MNWLTRYHLDAAAMGSRPSSRTRGDQDADPGWRRRWRAADCIDDADVLRTGGTAQTPGLRSQGASPSLVDVLCAASAWGHRPLNWIGSAASCWIQRAWSGWGRTRRSGPLTIDLDSTIGGSETYAVWPSRGVAACATTATRARGAIRPAVGLVAAGIRRRAARFRLACARAGPTPLGVPPTSCWRTVGRVRYAGARGQLTVRADSGFYTHAIVAACRRMDVRFSITVRQHARLRSLIEAIPEQDWTPIPYWMEGAADVAETSYTPFQSKPDAAPVRLIVRRVKPTPGSQLALFATYSYHGFITDREGETLALEADHRRHAEIENAIRDLKYGVGLNHLPSAVSPPTAPGWRCR